MNAPSTRIARDWSSRTLLVDDLLDQGFRSPDAGERERVRSAIAAMVEDVLATPLYSGRTLDTMLAGRIAAIDELVRGQLDEILHHQQFTALEATWRGLHLLTRRTGKLNGVRIKVLDARKKELAEDLDNAAESTLGRLLDRALETLGEDPFTAVLATYSFGPEPADMQVLARLARIGAGAHVPIAAAAAPSLLGGSSFAELPRGRALARLMAGLERASWRRVRGHNSSRHLVLTVPSVLMRAAPWYEDRDAVNEDFQHVETVTTVHALPWGSGAWVLGAELAKAFQTSWCGELHADPGGGVASRMAVAVTAELEVHGPTDVTMTDDQYAQLRDLGFAPLCGDAENRRVVLFEVPSCHAPAAAEDGEDGEDGQDTLAASRLECVLAECRVAHYVKCILREKRGAFASAAECEDYLNRWAANYTVPGHAQGRSAEHDRYPFVTARFSVHASGGGACEVQCEVLPNLRNCAPESPLVFSVSAVLRSPLRNELPPARQTPPPDTLPAAAPTPADPIEYVRRGLEQLGELKTRNLLDDTEFAALKRRLFAAAGVELPAAAAEHERRLPYGQMHAQVVEAVAKEYAASGDEKARALRAIAGMLERRALAPADSAPLSEVAEVALTPPAEGARESMTEKLTTLTRIAQELSQSAGSSPAARAISETARESAERACGEFDRRQAETEAKLSPPSFWRSLVFPDVEGAFNGGAAAAGVFPALQAAAFPLALPLAAALGVVIGAGVRSGAAYGEHRAGTS